MFNLSWTLYSQYRLCLDRFRPQPKLETHRGFPHSSSPQSFAWTRSTYVVPSLAGFGIYPETPLAMETVTSRGVPDRDQSTEPASVFDRPPHARVISTHGWTVDPGERTRSPERAPPRGQSPRERVSQPINALQHQELARCKPTCLQHSARMQIDGPSNFPQGYKNFIVIVHKARARLPSSIIPRHWRIWRLSPRPTVPMIFCKESSPCGTRMIEHHNSTHQ